MTILLQQQQKMHQNKSKLENMCINYLPLVIDVFNNENVKTLHYLWIQNVAKFNFDFVKFLQRAEGTVHILIFKKSFTRRW